MTQGEPADETGQLRDKRILVVEDEAIVAMLLENILEDIGCATIGPALTMEDARALAGQDGPVDAAILDVNLHGERIYPVAQTLIDRGVPVIFATGYGELEGPWKGRPAVQKPYTLEDIVRVLNGVFSA